MERIRDRRTILCQSRAQCHRQWEKKLSVRGTPLLLWLVFAIILYQSPNFIIPTDGRDSRSVIQVMTWDKRMSLSDGTCQHLTSSSSKVQLRKRAPSGCRPGNASPMAKLVKSPSKRWTEREYSRSSIKSQSANPFPKMGRWLFIVPVARGKTLILLGLFWMGCRFCQQVPRKSL